MRLFQPELSSQGLTNIVKVLSFSFEQCFGPFTILLVEGSSETRLFSRLPNHILRGPSGQKYISYQGHLVFEKVMKLNLNLQNATKKLRNCLSFLR